MVTATSVGNKMWFGTREYMQWIDTPKAGADVSPDSWSAGGTLLNGGGWQKNAFASHKTYRFAWRDSSARIAAQIMHSYRDGTWGEGLIYFVDPLTYTTNILPKGWADPSLAARGGASLIPGVIPTVSKKAPGLDTPQDFRLQNYPLMWANYAIPAGAPRTGKRLFVPIPEGFSLHLGVVWTGSDNTYMAGRRVKEDGTFGPVFKIESVPAHDGRVTRNNILGNGDAGIEIWVQKDGNLAGAISLKAMTARVQPEFKAPDAISRGPWIGGQGNSGCRFEGAPTYIEHNGVGGGQVGYAASFKEVGSWE